MNKKINDLTGKVFGDLTVIKLSDVRKHGDIQWECQCSCGRTLLVSTSRLTRPVHGVRNCGFSHDSQETGVIPVNIAGINKRDMPEYKLWGSARSKCREAIKYNYAANGIKALTMDPKWMESFENFIADMGLRPSPEHRLVRRNKNKGYSKGNCVWRVPCSKSIIDRTKG